MNMSVRHTFGFPFYQRFWTITERPQRLVTFGTFDQSDGVYGGLNASRIGLYGGSNARKCTGYFFTGTPLKSMENLG